MVVYGEWSAQTNKQTNKQTSKQTNKQTNKQTSNENHSAVGSHPPGTVVGLAHGWQRTLLLAVLPVRALSSLFLYSVH